MLVFCLCVQSSDEIKSRMESKWSGWCHCANNWGTITSGYSSNKEINHSIGCMHGDIHRKLIHWWEVRAWEWLDENYELSLNFQGIISIVAELFNMSRVHTGVKDCNNNNCIQLKRGAISLYRGKMPWQNCRCHGWKVKGKQQIPSSNSTLNLKRALYYFW